MTATLKNGICLRNLRLVSRPDGCEGCEGTAHIYPFARVRTRARTRAYARLLVRGTARAGGYTGIYPRYLRTPRLIPQQNHSAGLSL
jgi:hypothetical protein